jgi:hypothetical protein
MTPAFALLAVLATTAVIPAGQEPVLGRMLGAGETLGDCVFEGATIARISVEVRYRCGEDRVQGLVLAHPAATADATATTEVFAVIAPEMDPALLEAVLDRIRRHEDAWRWRIQETPPPRPPRPPPPPPPQPEIPTPPEPFDLRAAIVGLLQSTTGFAGLVALFGLVFGSWWGLRTKRR